MIIFYSENKAIKPLVFLETKACGSSCSSNCIKPKTKCCSKYKKKGINCKRCPLTFDVKIAS